MTHAEILIRPASQAEAADILHLVQWAMQVYASQSGITSPLDSQQETLTDMQRHIREDHVLVAEHKGHLIGTVRLVRLSDKTAYFSRFAVHPHLQRTGVGRMLYDAADIWLRQHQFAAVELHTALSNAGLVAFYQGRGFILVESENSRGYTRGRFRKELIDTGHLSDAAMG